MSTHNRLRVVLKLDQILPFLLMLLFLPFFAHYLRRNPGEFLTTWVTFAIIGLATEDVFTSIGDRVREWHRRRGLSSEDLTRLAAEGESKFRDLLEAATNDIGHAWVRTHDVIEDIKDLCDKMRPGIDRRLTTRSNLYGIVVYGLSAAVSFSIIDSIHGGSFYAWRWYLRGLCFAPAFFFWEYTWGWATEKLVGVCPWRYERSLVRWKRYIKPEYFVFWTSFGFVMEWTHLKLVPLILSTFTVLPHR